MFKAENRIWWYIIGLVFMFIIFGFFARDFLYPFIINLEAPFQNVEFAYRNPPRKNINENSTYQANFYTSKGIIVVRLYPQVAPENVNNFIFLSRQGYYENTYFHRVFKNFLIQGGDRNTLNENKADDGRGGPGYTVEDEVNWDASNVSKERREELRNQGYESTPGLESIPLRSNVLAMANSGPDTNGSQFFFVIADQNDPRLQALNGRFTVIGEVVSGGSVIRAISRVKLNTDNSNVPQPVNPIYLNRVEIIER